MPDVKVVINDADRASLTETERNELQKYLAREELYWFSVCKPKTFYADTVIDDGLDAETVTRPATGGVADAEEWDELKVDDDDCHHIYYISEYHTHAYSKPLWAIWENDYSCTSPRDETLVAVYDIEQKARERLAILRACRQFWF